MALVERPEELLEGLKKRERCQSQTRFKGLVLVEVLVSSALDLRLEV